MGYKIYTDHSKFSNGAAKIEEYIGTMNSYMMSMNGEVNNMLISWTGDDATSFHQKWQTTDEKTSTTKVMQADLKKYADDLRTAGSRYQNAQINSINEANNLPRWF